MVDENNLKEIELELIEIKFLYEALFEQYKKDGITVKWSKFVYKNVDLLNTPYNQIVNGIYDEEKDPDFIEFRQKQEELIKQYADRDEQGNIVKNEEKYVITEMLVEFEKANKELAEHYIDLQNKINNKNEINYKFLSQKAKIKIYNIDETDIPDVISPRILNIILK